MVRNKIGALPIGLIVETTVRFIGHVYMSFDIATQEH